jgi:hypothetical protein
MADEPDNAAIESLCERVMVLTRYGAHWVSAEDYMELEAQLAEAENQLDSARHSVDVLEKRAEAAPAPPSPEAVARAAMEWAAKVAVANGASDTVEDLFHAASDPATLAQIIAQAGKGAGNE